MSEIRISSAREIHLVPEPGTVIMEFGGRTYAVEEKPIGSFVLNDGQWDHSDFSPEHGLTHRFQRRSVARRPTHPAVQLREALMTCKKMGLTGSHIREIWDEFVARQVLES